MLQQPSADPTLSFLRTSPHVEHGSLEIGTFVALCGTTPVRPTLGARHLRGDLAGHGCNSIMATSTASVTKAITKSKARCRG